MFHLQGALVRRVCNPLLITRTYAGGYWNKDWKPGRYPETEQERQAAAKKYGLIREDYEPYADDGLGYGDYPKLPIVSAESRDPFISYDMDEFKRNYGEPMHVDADIYGEDRWDYNRRLPFPLWVMNLSFLGIIGFGYLIYLSGNYFKFWPVKMMPKQRPAEGKHYSFELAKDVADEKSC